MAKKNNTASRGLPGSGQDYMDLFESIRDGVYISDNEGNLLSANESLSNMFGYSREELLALNATRLYKNSKDRSLFKKKMQLKGFVVDYELQLQRKDGTDFIGLLNSTERRSKDGEIVGYQGIIRDISIQKFMEDAIEDTEKRFQVLFDESPDAILVQNEKGKVLDANPAAFELFGLSWEEIIDKSFLMLFPRRHQEIAAEDFEKFLSGETSYLETTFQHKSGKSIPVEIRVSLINYGGIPGVLQHITDVSKRKLAEKRLDKERQSGLKAVVDAQEDERRRISSELHDGLGQILTSIRFRMDTALRGKGIQHKMKQVEQVKGSIDEMITEVRAMSNKLMPALLRDLGLIAAINKFVQQSQEVTRTKLQFHNYGMDGRLSEEAEIGIYRIVQEAVNNCLKYAKASEINVALVKDGSVVRLMIEDDGVGFNPKTIFSGMRKKQGHGNGLGNMKNRSEILGGEILIESARSRGTTITVDFPIKKVQK
ncbi:MAG: PAS domain S-box protein [Flavobacteriales bacterium]|nr:PAS domain S-box protein [Flavobacteriales bacterium]